MMPTVYRRLPRVLSSVMFRTASAPRNVLNACWIHTSSWRQSQSLPSLSVSHRNSLMDETVSITVSGAESNIPVTIAAYLTENEAEYMSYAHYETDSNGAVNLSSSPSKGGSFVGVESMGLFWALKQVPSKRQRTHLRKAQVNAPFSVNFSAMKGHIEVNQLSDIKEEFCRAVAYRWYMKPGVQRYPVRIGRIRGTLFIPPGNGPFPAVLDMYGTAGGLVEHRAALLASHGIATFALAYFWHDDLPTALTVEFEYFLEAIDWLLSEPKVLHDKIGIIGLSKGGELALMLAPHFEQVKAVVAISCSSFMYAGEVFYKGQEIPSATLDVSKMAVKDGVYNWSECYETALGRDEASLEVEKIKSADILFISGEDDQISEKEAGMILKERSEKFGNNNFEWMSLPDTGHMIEPTNSPLVHSWYHRLFGIVVEFGGKNKPHAYAQQKAWTKILQFFHEKLSS